MGWDCFLGLFLLLPHSQPEGGTKGGDIWALPKHPKPQPHIYIASYARLGQQWHRELESGSLPPLSLCLEHRGCSVGIILSE